MQVTLPPDLAAMIRQKVEDGLFESESEVVREALRQMDERDLMERLRAAIAIAEEEVARGETVPWTPELHATILEEAIRDAKAGKLPDPDVLP